MVPVAFVSTDRRNAPAILPSSGLGPASFRWPRAQSLHRARRWRLLGLLPLFLTHGCSAVGVVNALTPRDNFTLVANIPYRVGPRRRLDLYLPRTLHPSAPVVVLFYGGEWEDGSKDLYLFVGETLAARGFIVAIPDYRIYPEVRYPDFLEDNAAAIHWVIDHIGQFGGNQRDLHLLGHSAGVYNAAMLALDRPWLGAMGLNPRREIRDVVCLAGPYDFMQTGGTK